jgi:hypothetical protein
VIPPQAIEECWSGPVDLGIGLKCNYPIVTSDQQYGLFREVVTDWYATLGQVDNWPHFYGDVWSIQLTARPGYYVDPEMIARYAIDEENEYPPFG